MAIRIVRFQQEDHIYWGVLQDGLVRKVPGEFPTTRDFLENGRAAAAEIARQSTGDAIPENDLELLSPVTRNQQFVCQAVNYRSHLRESGLNPDGLGANIIFRKASSCIVSGSADIVRPARVKLLDYEIELGLVVGARIEMVSRIGYADLEHYVAGVTMVNDVSARDVQLPEVQFYKGKSFRTFGPVGPYLCLLDASELTRLHELHLMLSVNGEVRQNAFASDMVYAPHETLTELSAMMDLYPGDLIATGTPGGVAIKAPPRAIEFLGRFVPDQLKWRVFVNGQLRNQRYLQPGDVIESRIRSDDGTIDLGVQRNTIVQGEA